MLQIILILKSIKKYYFNTERCVIAVVKQGRRRKSKNSKESWVLCCYARGRREAIKYFNEWAVGWWKKQEKRYYRSDKLNRL